MNCPSCTREVKDGLTFCPHCGFNMSMIAPENQRSAAIAPPPPPPRPPDQLRAWKTFFWIIIILIIFGATIRFISHLNTKKLYKACEMNRITGKFEDGAQQCEKVVRRMPKMKEAWVELARCYQGMDSKDKVLETVEKGLRWDSRASDLYAIRGQIEYSSNMDKEAVSDFDKALSIAPENQLANQFRGLICFKKGDYVCALEKLGKALKKASRPDEIIINSALGDVYFQKKDFENAKKAYLDVLSNDMNKVDISVKLIKTYIEMRNFRDASMEIDRILQTAPEDDNLQTLKIGVNIQWNKIKTIQYFKARKDCDDMAVMIYESIIKLIERINDDPEAYYGQKNPELETMLNGADSTTKCYGKAVPPERFATSQSYARATAATIKDTLEGIKKYLDTSGDSNAYEDSQRKISLLKRQFNYQLSRWQAEYQEVDIKAILREEAKQAAAATSTPSVQATSTYVPPSPDSPAPHRLFNHDPYKGKPLPK